VGFWKRGRRQRTNQRTTNQRTNQRTNEPTNERTNERSNERAYTSSRPQRPHIRRIKVRVHKCVHDVYRGQLDSRRSPKIFIGASVAALRRAASRRSCSWLAAGPARALCTSHTNVQASLSANMRQQAAAHPSARPPARPPQAVNAGRRCGRTARAASRPVVDTFTSPPPLSPLAARTAKAMLSLPTCSQCRQLCVRRHTPPQRSVLYRRWRVVRDAEQGHKSFFKEKKSPPSTLLRCSFLRPISALPTSR